ncbi:MAG: hypothetical protein R3F34_01305 [Planctomycetota bacterium]
MSDGAQPSLGHALRRTLVRGGTAPLAVFLLHLLFSKVLELYRPYPDLDVPMHVAGGVAFMWFADVALESFAAPFSTRLRAIVAWLATCTAAVFWEFAEWTTDRLDLTRAQGGLDDTMLDLLCGAVGGAVLVLLRTVRRPDEFAGRVT